MKKVYLLMVIGILLVISLGVGFSYSIWTQTEDQTTANTIKIGDLNVTLSNSSGAFTLGNQYPVDDATGKNGNPYNVTLTNEGSLKASYVVYLEKLKTSTLDGKFVKVAVNDGNGTLYSGLTAGEASGSDFTESKQIASGTLAPKGQSGNSTQISVKMWIDSSATTAINGQAFNGRIVVKSVPTDN